jgi:2-C-methyl-D-erythritol 2,4-cyclodiphosphate synthase
MLPDLAGCDCATGTEIMDIRIGIGFDSHEFKPGVPLRIGGMTLDHPEGLAGHSDGDVLLHAITDALLGSVAAGDIGSFFPPGDPRWKDADSAIFLNLAIEEIENAGYRIVNIDTTLILAAPKIAPIAGEMCSRVADLLGVEINQVSIKAKTPEGLSLDHVAQCHAVVLVERAQEPEELKSMEAVIESQRQLEDVVDDLLASVHGVPKKRTITPVYDTEDIT